MAFRVVAQGGGFRVIVGGEATAIQPFLKASAKGEILGRQTIAASTASGATTATWTALSNRATADNGDPGDTDAQLRLPRSILETEDGLYITATRDGVVNTFAWPWNNDTGSTAEANAGERFALNVAGEALRLFLHWPIDGELPYVVVRVEQGPVGEDVVVEVAMKRAVPGIGATKEQIDQFQASVAALDTKVDTAVGTINDEIARLPQTSGTVPDPVTQAEAENKDSTVARIWTPQRVWQAATAAIRAVVDQAFVTNLLSGAGIKAALEGLTGNARLLASAVQGLKTKFTDLDDTPAAYGNPGQVPKVNATRNGFVFADDEQGSGDGGATSFTGLSDTPSSYTGEGRKKVVVNAAETGLGFESDDGISLSDVQEPARENSDARWPENKLPQNIDDLADAFTEGGWKDGVANEVEVATVFSTVQRPSNPASSYTFQASVTTGPSEPNVYGVLRRRTTVPLSQIRAVTGDPTEAFDDARMFDGDELTSLGVVGNWEYYTTPRIALLPASTLWRGQRYKPWEIDGERVGVGEANVQADFGQTDTRADDYIKRKPTLVTRAAAEAGTANTPRLTSALRMAQAIDAQTLDFARDSSVQVPANQLRNAHEGSATTTLLNGPGVGVNVTSHTSSLVRGAFTLFRPIQPDGSQGYFDLDDATNQHGEVAIEVTWTRATQSSTSIGFDSEATPATTITRSGFVFLSDVRGSTAFSNTQPAVLFGVKVPNVDADLFLGTDKLGDQDFYLAKDAQNRLGYYQPYQGGSTTPSGTHNFTLGAVIRAIVFHTDAPAAPQGTGLTQAQVDDRIRALVRDFEISAHPATAVNITTGSTANTPTAWSTLATAAAITSAQAGRVLILFHMHAEVVTSTSGGGERVTVEVEAMRRRGASDDELVDEHFYGPRNVSQIYTREAGTILVWKDVAQAGDVYSYRVRTRSQVAAREVTFNTTDNEIVIMPIGR